MVRARPGDCGIGKQRDKRACDTICVLLLERRGYSKEEFGKTHPGGAVGKELTSR